MQGGKAGVFPFPTVWAHRVVRLPGGGGGGSQSGWKPGAAMKWLKRLNNPFLLGIEGFLAGAVIFFATHPDAADIVQKPSTPAAEQVEAETARSRA